MKVVKFTIAKHFTALVAILSARNSYVPLPIEMPKLGYATMDGKKLVSAVFLRRVEGGYGQIDGLTSNPECSQDERHRGIDLAVSALLQHAKKINVTKVLFTSKDAGTIMRSEKYGFKKSPLAVLVADLNNRSV